MFHHNSAGTYMDNNRKTVEKCRECIQENAGFLYSNNIWARDGPCLLSWALQIYPQLASQYHDWILARVWIKPHVQINNQEVTNHMTNIGGAFCMGYQGIHQNMQTFICWRLSEWHSAKFPPSGGCRSWRFWLTLAQLAAERGKAKVKTRVLRMNNPSSSDKTRYNAEFNAFMGPSKNTWTLPFHRNASHFQVSWFRELAMSLNVCTAHQWQLHSPNKAY